MLKKKSSGKKGKGSGSVNSTEMQNAISTLFANIKFSSPDNPIKKLMITSSVPNEGKTTISVELAKVIAASGSRVCLVENDLRRRSLASMLNVHPNVGFYSVISGQTPLKQAITTTPIYNLYFLDVEPNIPNPAGVLSSHRYKELVEALSEPFDYVIFDTPPVGTFVDAAIDSTLMDGVVMVVRLNETKRDDMVQAFDQLKRANANVIGICANFVEMNKSSYYYYSYYYNEAGERVKKSIDQSQPPAGTSMKDGVALPKTMRGADAHQSGGYPAGSYPSGVKPVPHQERGRKH